MQPGQRGYNDPESAPDSNDGYTIFTFQNLVYATTSLLGLAFIIGGVALGLGATAYAHNEDYKNDPYIKAVCNLGDGNELLGLPAICNDGPAPGPVPGFPLVNSDPATPSIVNLVRVLNGLGVNVTSLGDSRLQVGVLLEALTSQLILGESGDALTIDVDIDTPIEDQNVSVSTCTVAVDLTSGPPGSVSLAKHVAQTGLPSSVSEPTTGVKLDKIIPKDECFEASNFYITQKSPNHGVCVGYLHNCPNDGSMGNSNILGGRGNDIQGSQNVILGGSGNIIDFGMNNAIAAGNSHTSSGVRSVTAAGGDGRNAGWNSGLIGGFLATVRGDQSVSAGGEQLIIRGDDSFGLAGLNNLVDVSAKSVAVLGGVQSLITEASQSSAVTGGDFHTISESNNSAIISGNNVQLEDDNTAAGDNVLTTEAFRTSGLKNVLSASYTLQEEDHVLVVYTTAIGEDVNIDLGVSAKDGKHVIVKDIGDSSTNEITVSVNATDSLCGTSGCVVGGSIDINLQGGSLHLVYNNDEWFILS